MTERARRPAAAGADERGRRPHVRCRSAPIAWRRRRAAPASCCGGVPGVPPAKVVILGGGVSGTHAARMAMGMEANVTVIDRSLDRLTQLDEHVRLQLYTQYSTVDAIEQHVISADLVIGAVLVPGAAAPKLVTQRDARRRCGRARCWSTSPSTRAAASRPAMPTTHADPTYVVDGIVHYCVANMPGAVAAHLHLRAQQRHPALRAWRSPTRATGAPAPQDAHLRHGLNIHDGKLTYKAVAGRPQAEDYTPAEEALGL